MESEKQEQDDLVAQIDSLSKELKQAKLETVKLGGLLDETKMENHQMSVRHAREIEASSEREKNILSTSSLRTQELSEKVQSLEEALSMSEAKKMELVHANEKISNASAEWKDKAAKYDEIEKSNRAMKAAFDDALHQSAREKQQLMASQDEYHKDLKERVNQLESLNRNLSMELRVSTKENEARIMELEDSNSRLKTEIMDMEEKCIRAETRARQVNKNAISNAKRWKSCVKGHQSSRHF